MRRNSATCDFEFDPTDANRQLDAQNILESELLNEAGVWSCPHPSYEDNNQCVFHASDVTDSTAARELLLDQLDNKIRGETDRNTHQFIGMNLDKLDLSQAIVTGGSNVPLDLRFAKIKELNLEDSQIKIPLRLDGCTVNHIDCHNTGFEARIKMNNATFYRFDAESATFHNRTDFKHLDFKRANFFNVDFLERVFFTHANFEGYTLFRNTDFKHIANFNYTSWTDRSTFMKSDFYKDGLFEGIVLDNTLSITDSTFHSEAHIEPKIQQGASEVNIDLSESKISEGTLSHSGKDDELRYDLTDATLGDVTLSGPNKTDFSMYTIINTSFDDFDFAKYTDSLLAINWLIHAMEHPPPNLFKDRKKPSIIGKIRRGYQRFRWSYSVTRSDNYSPGELRSTYLRAKNGAKAVGDDTAASEFFRLEMQFKRKAHYNKFKRNYSLGGLKDWIFNWFYNLTAGYGERPFRTFISAIFIVVLFANFYLLASPDSYTLPIISEYMIFSAQAFVALVLGEPQGNRFPLLAAAEAFLGAFMIALFVFTLTRSIHR
jgi:uncharacterized protein YjbI with pentapeptide repeats